MRHARQVDRSVSEGPLSIGRVSSRSRRSSLPSGGVGSASAADDIARQVQAGTTSPGTGLHDPVPDARAVQARRPVPQGHARRRLRLAQRVALWATVFSAVALLLAGFLGETMLASYGVPLDILRLAGGIILFLVALKTVLEQFAPAETPSDEVALSSRRRHESRDAAAGLPRNRDALWHCGARRVSRLQPEHGDPACDRRSGRGASWR